MIVHVGDDVTFCGKVIKVTPDGVCVSIGITYTWISNDEIKSIRPNGSSDDEKKHVHGEIRS